MTSIIDKLLTKFENSNIVAFSKDDSDETFKALDKLRAFGLVELVSNNSWCLTKEGYTAIEMGGFINWKQIQSGQSKDIFTNILLLLKNHAHTGKYIDLSKENLNIKPNILKTVCATLQKENKIEIKANGEYAISFGNGDHFSNVTGKVLARIKPEGLLFLKQIENSLNISNFSIITGDSNRVDQSQIENSNNNIIKNTNSIGQKKTKRNPIIKFIVKFWWVFIIPLIIKLIILGIEKGWFNF